MRRAARAAREEKKQKRAMGALIGALAVLIVLGIIALPSWGMSFEIERKFLVTGDFKSQAYSSSRIRQGYISTVGKATVRVRIRDDKGYLTIKGRSNEAGISRYEFETEVPLQDAEDLMRLCEPGVIDKTRYLVRSGRHVFEVDEFYGDNEGLIMAEVELSDEQEAFEKPGFIGREVTGDRRYYNSHLRTYPYKLWREG